MEYQDQNIPKYWLRFFRWICHDIYVEEIEGDLLENFQRNYDDHGPNYARRQFRMEVIKMIRPSVIKSINPTFNWINIPIFYSHSKVALRNLRRYKLFSILNISGLAIGMTVSLLIISLISDLLKFDQFHVDKNRIFRVTSSATYDSQRTDHLATSPLPLATVLKASIPGIEKLTTIRRFFSAEAKVKGKILPLKGHLADQDFFDVFTFPMIQGDPATALLDPFSVVLTEKSAYKLFGKSDAMGQIIRMGEFGNFNVKGVLKDIPLQSHIQFEVLGSMSSLSLLEQNEIVSRNSDDWTETYSNYCYFKLAEGQHINLIETEFDRIASRQYKRFEDLNMTFEAQPLLSIVPGPEYSNKIGPSMTYTPLIILSVIALLILLSACFNYTNLSIARSLRRAKEVGLRKVIGAGRIQITFQFLIESILIALISLGFAVILFNLIRPGFYNIIPRADQFNLVLDQKVIVCFIVFAVFSGFLAGIVPSIVLSKLKPVVVLKDMLSEKFQRRFTLRKALITFQFVLSIIFIVGASIVLKQYKYALNKDLGFEQENILNVDLFDTDHQLFINEFSKIPEIRDISFCSNIAGLGSTNAAWVVLEEKVDSMAAYYISVDNRYVKNHQIKLNAGSDFSEVNPEESVRSILLNEAFLKRQKWDHSDALNRWVSILDNDYKVIGIVDDFNYTHLEEPIKPFVFIQLPDQYNIANLKIGSSDVTKLMTLLESQWSALKPNHSFHAAFLEDQIEEAYDFLKNAMTLFGFLAFLAISIACLGMLGMAMYAAETRAKEVSIRKVFGASIWDIFHSLSRRFYILLAIASFIALPIVYLLFDQVILANFAFRVKIGPLELLSGLVAVLILGLFTIGSQTWRVASVNPSDSLRGL